ncbi:MULTISPECIES: MarR family winged helix-turn-helix transcriptional regulator [unclassified Variovorax]|uniref:MarR family winged helix-turn-helix transcriptional regulator n=1 Tax=unclassified Variovorax TaxID=663243 RepID=UPI001315BFE9|nr:MULTISPECIES: MarR family winged helix-turn-helix transcriptional regulator [unclassified Variovorax]VTU15760.1 homoprotocatechuate degradation operon regulator, HpaR [Variovorax sp. SRS16]VTU23844.1 homoprotocatechuate degradation operon regulator, HpaR [Variovorax sp. PBL-E5]
MPANRAPAPVFRRLLSYEVNSTSDALRRSAALRFRREHDTSLMEWRTLALIDYLQPVTLRVLTDYSSTDKAQISRIVSALVERRMVARNAHSTDARSAQLELTALGSTTLKGLSRSAQARDRAFRSVLSEDEAAQLVTILAKLKIKALAMVAEEEKKQP